MAIESWQIINALKLDMFDTWAKLLEEVYFMSYECFVPILYIVK